MNTRLLQYSLPAIAFITTAFVAGCDQPQTRQPAPFRPADIHLSNVQPAPVQGDPVIAGSPIGPAGVVLYKITLPLGTCTDNEKVWRQMDEDAFEPAVAAAITRNALRAAMAPQSRWPEIAKLLNAPGASNQQQVCQTDGKSTVTVITAANIESETIFYIDNDNTQHGRTYEKCDNQMLLGMHTQRGTTDTIIEIQPVVFMGSVALYRQNQQIGAFSTVTPNVEVFNNLRLTAAIPQDSFLLLAPSNPKKSHFSLGTRFLSDLDHVPATETIFVFVPNKPPALGSH